MTIKSKQEQILVSFEDKEYRDIYVGEAINTGLPFQIRAMRQARGWSQQELANRLGMKQGAVSRLESPNYGRYSLATLKRIASAFDVALIVRFAPFSELAAWQARLSPENMAVPDFSSDYLRRASALPVASPVTTSSEGRHLREARGRTAIESRDELEVMDMGNSATWVASRPAVGSGSTVAMELSRAA